MRKYISILVVSVCCLLLAFCCGCEEVLAGIGIGTAASETLDSWEENLEAKGIELAQEYEKAIIEMQNASDPNELAFIREKVQQIQMARIANLSALAVVQEIKSGEQAGGEGRDYPNPLYGLIPLVAAWGTNELRKRVKSERKRKAEKHGRELALRELAVMDEKEITAPLVKKIMYKDIGDALGRK